MGADLKETVKEVEQDAENKAGRLEKELKA